MIALALFLLGTLICCIVACVVDIFEAEERANHEALLDELWGDE